MGATRPIPRGYFGLGPKVTKTPLKGGGTLCLIPLKNPPPGNLAIAL